jgi:hypothetical protein
MKTFEDSRLIENFWSKVPTRDCDECWIWEGAIGPPTRGGFRYGRIFRRLPNSKFMAFMAHRVSWEIHHSKSIPAGMIVRHKCDNPLCVNPDHLEIGTHIDNMSDSVKRGRIARGIKDGNSKLINRDILNIRRRSSSGESYSSLGREYGVAYTTISRICRGITWTHI